MKNIIPIFSTHYSLGRSLLTCQFSDELQNNKPISVIALAKKYNLKELFISDYSFAGFRELYLACEKANIKLNFGVKLNICENAANKDEDSLSTESKIIVWMKNSEGYKDILKLYSAFNADKDNFYYHTRGDWNILHEYWTDNLLLTFPAYDSFLYKNLLESGKCMPDLKKINPIFFYSDMNLPFDQILIPAIKEYCKVNKILEQEIHPIYYYSKKDSLAYQTLRCISQQTSLEKPNLEHFSSSDFCFERFCEKTGIEFLN